MLLVCKVYVFDANMVKSLPQRAYVMKSSAKKHWQHRGLALNNRGGSKGCHRCQETSQKFSKKIGL